MGVGLEDGVVASPDDAELAKLVDRAATTADRRREGPAMLLAAILILSEGTAGKLMYGNTTREWERSQYRAASSTTATEMLDA